jgi:hypothetical protein
MSLLASLNCFRLAQERLAQMEIEARGWFYEQVSSSFNTDLQYYLLNAHPHDSQVPVSDRN